MRSLSILGIGSVLLIVWRFFSLSPVPDMLVWNAAVGALAVGVGATVANTAPTRDNRFALLLWALAFGVIHQLVNPMVVIEEITVGIALILLVGTFLLGQRWWVLALAAAIAVVFEVSQFGSFDPWRWLLVGLLGMLLVRVPWWVLGALGAVCFGVGLWMAFADVFLNGPGTLLMAGFGLLTLVVPTWGPLVNVGRHAVSLYALGLALAASFGEGSVTFGWTMYIPEPAPYSGGPTTWPLGFTFPQLWVGIGMVAVCAVCAWHRGKGPLERLAHAAYRHL